MNYKDLHQAKNIINDKIILSAIKNSTYDWEPGQAHEGKGTLLSALAPFAAKIHTRLTTQ